MTALLTTAEAAARAGMTVAQFRGHRRRGHITPARKIDTSRGECFYRPSDVDRLARTVAKQRAAAWEPTS